MTVLFLLIYIFFSFIDVDLELFYKDFSDLDVAHLHLASFSGMPINALGSFFFLSNVLERKKWLFFVDILNLQYQIFTCGVLDRLEITCKEKKMSETKQLIFLHYFSSFIFSLTSSYYVSFISMVWVLMCS